METFEDHQLTNINDLISQLADDPGSPDATYQIIIVLEKMAELLASVLERKE